MIEYFKKKLEALLDSVLEPFWEWLLAASLKIRIAALIICGAVVSLVAYPDIFHGLFIKVEEIARVALVPPQRIPVSNQLTNKTKSTVNRLSQTVKGDLLKLTGGSMMPWSAAQAVAAVTGLETVTLDKNVITSFIRSNTAPGCACWTEIPQKTADPQCLFISGWVMTSLADMDVPATSKEIRYALEAQNSDGWWPIFHNAKQSQYASTYSTAWLIIGLLSQKNKGFIGKEDAQEVDNAVTKAAGWLLEHRDKEKKGRWKMYPNLNANDVSESISGLALHALHLSMPDQVTEIDKEWIDNLPTTTTAATDGENYYIEIEGTNPLAIDHFAQLKMPWLLIGTIDAYSNGDMVQRAKSLIWIEKVLDHESVARADADQNNWWRAELLYSLRYTLKRI